MRTRFEALPAILAIAGWFVFAAVAPIAGHAQGAAPSFSEQEITALRAAAEASYEVIPVRDGLVLKPRHEMPGVRSIEITDVTVAVDGEPLDEAALRQRLGGDADLVLRLSKLGSAGLQAVAAGEKPSKPPLPPEPPEAAEAPAPPQPPEPPAPPSVPVGEKVVVGSNVTIAANEVAQEVVVIGGNATIDGEVRREVVVIGGSAHINGEVGREVTTLGGSVFLGPKAVVRRDVQAVGGQVHSEPGAQVLGSTFEGPGFGPIWSGSWIGIWPRVGELGPHLRFGGWAWGLFWRLVFLVLLVLLVSLVALVAEGPVDRIAAKVRADPWKAALVGWLSQVLFVPLLVVTILVLIISVIGIPLLILLPFAFIALVLLAVLGYTGVAVRLGRWSRERFGWKVDNRFAALLVGVAMIEMWGFLEALLDLGGPLRFFALLVGLFGLAVQYVAWTVGFGGVLLTRLGAGPRTPKAQPAVPPPAPAPAAPPGAAGEALPPAGYEEGEQGLAEEEGDGEPREPV